jgi:hypothetical protein
MTPHEEYLDTVRRLEPDIHPIDAAAGYASGAISLKRIADSLEFIIGAAKLLVQEEVREGGDVPKSVREYFK